MITPAMLPRPDPARQSVEDWFKLFKAVTGGLVQLYCSVGQEIIGQRQALATLTPLLNRNASERKLTTRILTECENLEQTEELIRLTIGDLESECQAAGMIFDMKRGNSSLEDFYARLLENERKANMGMSCIIKKFIAELPYQIKPSMFKKYEKAKSKSMSGTLNKQRAEELYAEARTLFYEKCNKSDRVLVVEDELSQRTVSLELSMKRHEEQLQEIKGTLQAYSVNDK